MYYTEQRKKTLSKSIVSLWVNWALSMGAVCLLIATAPVIKPKLVPVMALILEMVLVMFSHRSRSNYSCMRLIYISEIILFFSAVLLAAIYLYVWVYGFGEITGQPSNPDNPQLPVLVIAPVSLIVGAFYLIRGTRSGYCFNCIRNNGGRTDRGFLDQILFRETQIQLKSLTALSALMTLITWSYYLLFYNNISINQSDTYFFVLFPAGLFLTTLIVFGMRYYGMWLHLTNSETTMRFMKRSATIVRYLIICGDKMLLSKSANSDDPLSSDDLLIDTPLSFSLDYTETVTLHQAKEYFRNASEIPAEIRPLYESHDTDLYQNLFHFAAFVNESELDKTAETFHASWLSLQEINEMMRHGLVSSLLNAEIHRIYNVAMAWKTYDKNGHRLYPIRHYRPTFHLRDMIKWDVDYNDPVWIKVAHLNEDSKFFRARSICFKILTGHR